MQKSGSREVLDEDSTEQAGAGRSALLTRVRSRGLPTGARWRAAAGRAGAASRAAAPYGPADRDRPPRGRRAGAVAVVAAEPHEPAFRLPVHEHGAPARTQVFFFL